MSQSASESRIHMYQAILCTGWADGKLDASEKAILTELIHQWGDLSEDQRSHLLASVDNPGTIDTLWDKITNPMDRAYLLDISEKIFYADGNFCDVEKEFYNQLYIKQLTSLSYDLQKLDLFTIQYLEQPPI